MNQAGDIDRLRALAVFTRKFSAMVEAGIRYLTCMRVLAEEAPAPYSEFCRSIPRVWEEDEYLPLSSAMEAAPDLFSTFYVKTIRWGEVGGIPDEPLSHLADLLEMPWRLPRAPGYIGEWAPLLLPVGAGFGDWCELSPRQRTMLLMLCCRTMGAMLSVGVPIILAGDVMAELLPANQREQFRVAYEPGLSGGKRASEVLEELGFAGPFISRMFRIGEEAGNLDVVLEKLAVCYEKQIGLEA